MLLAMPKLVQLVPSLAPLRRLCRGPETEVTISRESWMELANDSRLLLNFLVTSDTPQILIGAAWIAFLELSSQSL